MVHHLLRVPIRRVLLFVVGLSLSISGYAQTQPTAQLLPYTFTGQTAEVAPAGMAIHRFGTSSSTIPTSRTTSEGNGDLPYSTTSSAGGWLNAGTNGADGIGLLASGSNAAGAVVVSINTTGKQDVTVKWLCRVITSSSTNRDNSIALQYRIGQSGNFIDVGTTSTYSSAGKTAGDASSLFTEILPAAANDQPEVQVRWVYWESSEGLSGGRDRIAVDEIAINGAATGPDVTAPVISTRNPADNASNVSLGSSLVATFSENVVKGTGNITITLESASTDQVIDVADAAVVVVGNQVTISGVSLAYGEAYHVTIDAGAFADAAGNLFVGESDATLWNFTVVNDPGVPTLISSIQGTGESASSGTYTISGIVTAVFPNWSPAGFYVQEEDGEIDGDPLTSEAIYVVQDNPTVLVGDLVLVAGDVKEDGTAPSYGQAIITPTSVSVTSGGNALPAPVAISLPATSATYLERFEGMLVQYSGTLTVTDNYDLGSYGSIKLSQGGIVYQPTQLIDPNDVDPNGTTFSGKSNVTAINNLLEENALRTLILDDGRSVAPVVLPYVNSDNTLRIGSTVQDLTGILGYGYSAYRIQKLPDGHPLASTTSFTYAPRPTTVPAVGAATVKVASFNVLNYFNGDGLGGGFPTSRGAITEVEFNRQRAKIITAIGAIDADVVGLLEIENDGNDANSALADIVSGLNSLLGANTYAYITEPFAGSDAIRCAIIYKPAKVSPMGAALSSNNPVFNRPPLAQNFQIVSSAARTSSTVAFNYIINHFKSKGCGSASGLDADQNDGQGCYNSTRTQQSAELINFINTVKATSGNDYVISMGDYNAYYQEDPLDRLRNSNMMVLANSTDYSYQFGGQMGSLDHAVVSSELNSLVSGVAKWNINSVEPTYLSYKDGIDSGGSDQANPWSSTYSSDAFRSSDHDAVIVGLDFSEALPVELVAFQVDNQTKQVVINWETASETNNDHFSIEKSVDAIQFSEIGRVDASGDQSVAKQYQYIDTKPFAGLSYYRLVQVDLDGTRTVYRMKGVNRANTGSTFTLYPNPVQSELTISAVAKTQDTVYSYDLLNSTGQVLLKGSGLIGAIEASINAQIHRVDRGLYILKLYKKDEAQYLKFIKD
ncbi:putative secreted protein (Por secretion system target) [Dyadobacter jejuensis]|uniref:Putative secreted protein (Por secretion system target) n=1 Tax=Dyadobacter jejuensis TaxID=1082580 RepID=A0A316AR90_9BACT|nr:ExeM/NucH family extracellular endonuclease [Dyadobacter jejuensis]PWJ60235.1 putative secreted protein (Por secretion system target) [Dyadobacter jejuensis]